ncbi:Protein-tyrosine phosphatase catalytic [Penicillium angulare]|uniref:phosphatidylinositol-3,4,5-trisphosphate 3-phosphatase n=1 Tax=Penicillium angulare TaxID=116970 RepID=A0A9W9G847_9EURO|nr:Protein-tyrosine phosphatase catalytic [Penicillium angulare]
MASILRQIVAGPRLQHPESNLDLCYVTDKIIATSGPSGTYPQRAYRNPLDALVNFLDSKHGSNWCIWEFRAEGTGYPDSEVYGRIHHFPWPDHHPPPFALLPNIMGSMRNWIHKTDDITETNNDKDEGGSNSNSNSNERVIVVHCKAGKGRSGTIATGYLISQEGWKKEDALQRFTERRMRVGFGAGVSIPSQLRYVGYIDRWTNELNKEYVERPVEILEVHIWGLRDGVKVAIEGFEDEGKKIKPVHMFHKRERTVIDSGNSTPKEESQSQSQSKTDSSAPSAIANATPQDSQTDISTSSTSRRTTGLQQTLSAVIFRPENPVIVPGSDVNIDFERRSKASYTGFAMVTSVAHVWFNAFFEGGRENDSGVFETEWAAMDGIKGSARKGIRALERLKVVWRYPVMQDKATAATTSTGRPISEPKPGEPICESHPADWRGSLEQPRASPEDKKENKSLRLKERGAEGHDFAETPAKDGDGDGDGGMSVQELELERRLGLRAQTDASKDVSLAGTDDERSATDDEGRVVKVKENENGDMEGVQSYFEKNGESK